MSFDIESYLSSQKNIIDTAMANHWSKLESLGPENLAKAMSYSLFAPGKRIRPVLVFASAEALGMPSKNVLPVAAALEMIHVFSLIHDDLPAMDDDDLRRGQPTNHKIFGDALAILAGDALLAQAFVPLSELDTKIFDAQRIIELISLFAQSTGTKGMVAGQVMDLESEKKRIGFSDLVCLHRHKTGALIRLAVIAPAILVGSPAPIMNALNAYGEAIGLAFQVVDDILDIEGGEELGKDIGSDVANDKSTYPSLLGLDGAKQEAKRLLSEALQALEGFDERANALRHIARFVVERRR